MARSLAQPIVEHAPPVVTTDADRKVHLEATTLREEMILQFTNLVGVAGTSGVFRVVPTRFNVEAPSPAGKPITAVYVTSPDNRDPELQPLSFSTKGDRVTFTLSVHQYSMVILKSE